MSLDSHFSTASRGYRLAGMAALAYSLVIVYASLQPFTDWRALSQPFGDFLFEPWPRWITVDDILFNFAAYVPLGFLLTLFFGARWSMQAAVVMSIIACTTLSYSLEAAQQYLPARFASNVDLLVNGCGGTLGALLAPLFSPGQRLGHVFVQLRNRGFVEGPRGDAVLVLAGLWMVTQLYATPIALGNGDLREGLGLAALFDYAPGAYLLAEAAVVMFSATGLGLLLASAARDNDAAYWRTLALVFAGAGAMKTAAALLILRAPNPWSWLTPGFGMGLAAALVLLLVITRLPHRVRAATALCALCAAIALVNVIPENPYRPAPSHLLSGRISHFLSFTSMTHALSDIWPFLAMLFLLFSPPARNAPIP